MANATIRGEEAAHFGALAADWWDPKGSSAMLHRLNPVRLGFLREAIDAHWQGDSRGLRPLAGKRALDAGCGAGLLCEPLARLGAAVTGVDAAAENIAAASAHAAGSGLSIEYHCGEIGALDIGQFDLVCSMEVIEHVADPGEYLRTCSRLLAPGGLMIVATLNRTLKAFALAKVGAEYVLRWVPAGTHDWTKFLKPDELRGFLKDKELQVQGPFGVTFDPLNGRWCRSSDCDINYMMTVTRDAVREATKA